MDMNIKDHHNVNSSISSGMNNIVSVNIVLAASLVFMSKQTHIVMVISGNDSFCQPEHSNNIYLVLLTAATRNELKFPLSKTHRALNL